MIDPKDRERNLERYFRHVQKTDTCWLWTGEISTNGYARFHADRAKHSATRWLYQTTIGPLEKRLRLCHTCDVRHCVNPSHLFVGTDTDNMRDCINKGRFVHNVPYGSRSSKAKLNEAQVVDILTNPTYRAIGSAEVANSFGVSRSAIQKIWGRRRWKQIKA